MSMGAGIGVSASSALREIVRYLRATNNPLLMREQREFPGIREFIVRPYVNRNWGLQRRLHEIANHCSLVQVRVPFFDLHNGEWRDLTQYQVAGNSLRIVMDRPRWMRGEGQLGISLFYGCDRIYTAMLHLSGTPENLQLIVGNLQGDGRDRLTLYRTLTKLMHCMRPRDFLIHIVRILAAELHCREVLGVCDAAHRSSHALSRGEKLATYDEIWLEHGALKSSQSGFFSMATGFQRRASHEIPANKRGMYRRRYQLLDDLQLTLRERIAAAAYCGAEVGAEEAAEEAGAEAAGRVTTRALRSGMYSAPR
jgi:uncharacterized protein VirK/YbjX